VRLGRIRILSPRPVKSSQSVRFLPYSNADLNRAPFLPLPHADASYPHLSPQYPESYYPFCVLNKRYLLLLKKVKDATPLLNNKKTTKMCLLSITHLRGFDFCFP
jgi:hypothetical protein